MGMLHDQALHRLENPGPICCSTILNFKMQTESNCGKGEPEKRKKHYQKWKTKKIQQKNIDENTRKYIYINVFFLFSFPLCCFVYSCLCPICARCLYVCFFCACSFSLFLCPVCFTSPFQTFSSRQASHDKIICNLNYFWKLEQKHTGGKRAIKCAVQRLSTQPTKTTVINPFPLTAPGLFYCSVAFDRWTCSEFAKHPARRITHGVWQKNSQHYRPSLHHVTFKFSKNGSPWVNPI